MPATVNYIPAGYHTITPYLALKNARGCLEFLQKAFDAKLNYCMDGPDGAVAHADLNIGDSHIMLSEACAQWGEKTSGLYLYVKDTDALYHKALAAGATSILAPADQFYGDRMAGVADAFGNTWWIGTHIEDVSPEELEKRKKEMMAKK